MQAQLFKGAESIGVQGDDLSQLPKLSCTFVDLYVDIREFAESDRCCETGNSW